MHSSVCSCGPHIILRLLFSFFLSFESNDSTSQSQQNNSTPPYFLGVGSFRSGRKGDVVVTISFAPYFMLVIVGFLSCFLLCCSGSRPSSGHRQSTRAEGRFSAVVVARKSAETSLPSRPHRLL